MIFTRNLKSIRLNHLTVNKQLQRDKENLIILINLFLIKGIQCQLIYPATDKHIKKYTFQEMFIIEESYENYLNLTKKVIEKESFSLQVI